MTASSQRFFLDTAYVLARQNERDYWHAAAVGWEARLATLRVSLVTTEYVLAEIGDALAKVRFRQQATVAIDILRSSSWVEAIPSSPELFAAGFDLYRNRPDKNWGLTDCCSFAAMRDRGLTAALTTDEHFRQAGFRALLLEDP